jgi:hypothetical protein
LAAGSSTTDSSGRPGLFSANPQPTIPNEVSHRTRTTHTTHDTRTTAHAHAHASLESTFCGGGGRGGKAVARGAGGHGRGRRGATQEGESTRRRPPHPSAVQEQPVGPSRYRVCACCVSCVRVVLRFVRCCACLGLRTRRLGRTEAELRVQVERGLVDSLQRRHHREVRVPALPSLSALTTHHTHTHTHTHTHRTRTRTHAAHTTSCSDFCCDYAACRWTSSACGSRRSSGHATLRRRRRLPRRRLLRVFRRRTRPPCGSPACCGSRCPSSPTASSTTSRYPHHTHSFTGASRVTTRALLSYRAACAVRAV